MEAGTIHTQPIESPVLAELAGIRHAYFTRHGGVSDGLYASFNTGLGSDDSRENVLANRARACAYLGVEPEVLATPYQIHSPTAVHVRDVWLPGEGPRADALVTDRPGIAVGVGTADCGPVLFAEPEAGIIAATHAGWKGAIGGVLESTIDLMEDLGADRRRISAVLGPTIAATAYEVGQEFFDHFVADNAVNSRFFTAADRADHAMFDLPAYILDRLTHAGIRFAEALNLCTYADPQRFFSFRRATHKSEADYGRLLSAIVICDP